MTAYPHNQTLLCVTDVPKFETVLMNGIAVVQDNIQEFEVILASDDLKSRYQSGDRIVTDVFPTQIVYDRKTFYLVKAEHVAGKVNYE